MWQNDRIGKFTASELYKLFVEPKTIKDKEAGVWSETAMTYIFEKAVEQTTGWRKEFSSKATEHGVVNEFEAFEAFKKATGMDFTLTSTQFFPYGQNSGASPDGVLFHDFNTITAVMDVKCPFSPVSFFEQKNEWLYSNKNQFQGVPKPYFYQMQLQMLSTGCKVGYLVRYLTSNVTDQYGNKHEFDMPLDKRLFWSEVKLDEEVAEQIKLKLDLAEQTKQSIIKNLM